MKIWNLSLFLFFFGIFLFPLSAEDTAIPLENDLAELFREIRKVSPATTSKLDRPDRIQTLEKVLADLHTGIRPSSVKRLIQLSKTELKNDSNTMLYPGKLIRDNTILYLRLDALTPASVRQLSEDCVSAARLANKPTAAILDLRGAVGGNRNLIPKILLWFIAGTEKPETTWFQEHPLLILTSRTTRGAPELLAAVLAQKKRIAIGEPTAGDLFPVQPVKAAGAVWLVPVIPEEFNAIPPLPFQPQISMPAGMPVTKKGATPEERLSGDPALRHAVDLIEALHVLNKPQK